jgi:predicted nucleic acid-binding protein
MISGAEPFAITGIVVAEVLQGLKRNVNAIESYLFQWQMLEPQGFTTYRETAAIFRAARARGISATTTDALIAAITVENNATLFTLDRDFVHLASVINLPLHLV